VQSIVELCSTKTSFTYLEEFDVLIPEDDQNQGDKIGRIFAY
jgi:hypothetical protein